MYLKKKTNRGNLPSLLVATTGCLLLLPMFLCVHAGNVLSNPSGSNEASGANAVVAGGVSNFASDDTSYVGGGEENEASSVSAVVSGGFENKAGADFSVVGGGLRNEALIAAYASFIGGGKSNEINSHYAVISGGRENTANEHEAVVGGGYDNTASGRKAVVAGGSSNTASGQNSNVSGGSMNTASKDAAIVSGGYLNEASGIMSTVPGGRSNFAIGDGSVAMGSYATAKNDESFVVNMLSCDDDGPFAECTKPTQIESTKENQVIFAAAEFNIRIGSVVASIHSENIARLVELLDSSVPSNDCEDSAESKKFKIVDDDSGDQKGKRKACSWAKTEERCGWEAKNSGEIRLVKDFCPKTCGECDTIVTRGRALTEEKEDKQASSATTDAASIVSKSMQELKDDVSKQNQIIAKLHDSISKQDEIISKQDEAIEAMRDTNESIFMLAVVMCICMILFGWRVTWGVGKKSRSSDYKLVADF